MQYKISKSRRYWPTDTKAQRIKSLLSKFQEIHDALSAVFGPLELSLPVPDHVGSLSALKRYEDALDALVCAWVGVCYMQGEAVPLGDDKAAIWCPRDAMSPNR